MEVVVSSSHSTTDNESPNIDSGLSFTIEHPTENLPCQLKSIHR